MRSKDVAFDVEEYCYSRLKLASGNDNGSRFSVVNQWMKGKPVRTKVMSLFCIVHNRFQTQVLNVQFFLMDTLPYWLLHLIYNDNNQIH